LEFLVGRYQVLAVHAAFLIVADRPLAEDIVQDAFVKAAERIGQFDAARPFRPWFLRLVVNDCLKSVNRRQRNLSLDDASDDILLRWMDLHPGPERRAVTNELRRAGWNALQKLTPEGMSFAGTTGGPEGVLLVYLTKNGRGGAILIGIFPWSEEADQKFEVSNSATVETVAIGPLAGSGLTGTGEYATGEWGGPALQNWNSSPDLQTLRWRDGDALCSMMSVGGYQGPLLDRQGMAALAAAMTADPAVLEATPDLSQWQPTPTLPAAARAVRFSDRLPTVQAAEGQAGFDVAEPTWLPDKYHFLFVAYTPANGNVCLFYKAPVEDPALPSLVIIQNPSGTLPDLVA
jgi:RNA polymerase sigma factor (sigma-70 family)